MLEHAAERLTREFTGIFSPETVEEVLRDSASRWVEAPIQAQFSSSPSGSHESGCALEKIPFEPCCPNCPLPS